MGTMHPTGFPAYVLLGWLASVVLRRWASRPSGSTSSRRCSPRAPSGTTVLVLRRLAVPLPVAVAAALGFALTPIAWGISAAADAHALHLALVALVVLGARALGRASSGRAARPRTTRRRPAGPTARSCWPPRCSACRSRTTASRSCWSRPSGSSSSRWTAACSAARGSSLAALGASLGVAALLYLELPLRAGPFPAPLVYGHPDTWSGFWDIVLARQFQGDVAGRSRTCRARPSALARLAGDQLGVLAVLVRPAFLVTAVPLPALRPAVGRRRSPSRACSRRATRTRTSAATTWAPRCSPGRGSRSRRPRSSSGSSPGRGRGDATDDEATSTRRRPPWRPALRTTVAAAARAWPCSSPPAWRSRTAGGPRTAPTTRPWPGGSTTRWRDARAGRRRRLLVVQLHDAVVRHARRGPPAGHPDRGRLGHRRRGAGRGRGRDRHVPRRPARVRHPRARRRHRGTGRTLCPSNPSAAPPASTASRASRRPSHDRPRSSPRRRRRARAGRAPVVLLPGPQRGGQPRGPGERGPRDPAVDRGDVRDHRRQRRLEGPDPRDRRPARRRAPGRRAGRPPRGEPRLRRRAALRVRGVTLRPARLHGRRPPVPGRGPRAPHGAPGRGRPPRRRRGLPDQARRPAHPDRVRPDLQARQPDLLRPPGPRRGLRRPSCSGARRSRACAWSPAAPSSPRSCWSRSPSRAARSSRSASPTTRAPPARRRARSCR